MAQLRQDSRENSDWPPNDDILESVISNAYSGLESHVLVLILLTFISCLHASHISFDSPP